MAPEDEENGNEEQEPEGGGKKKLLIIIIAAVVVIGGAAGALLMGGGAEEEHSGEIIEEEVHYQRADFGEFIVNLSSSTSFAKIHLVVEYDPNIVMGGGEGAGGGHAIGGGGSGGGDAEAGLPGVFGEKEPVIRDAIIGVIASKTKDEVLTTQGKEVLKEELVDIINEACELEEDPVVAVYFQSFLVQ